MLHPLMPFITEELWNANERPYELIVAKWPEPEVQIDRKAKAELERVIELVSDIRAQRTDVGIPPGAKLQVTVLTDGDAELDWLNRHKDYVIRLGRVVPVRTHVASMDVPGGILESEEPEEADEFSLLVGNKRLWNSSIQLPSRGLVLSVNVGTLVDLDAERARLSKAAAAAEKERDSLAQRLANPAFTERAKPEAVDKARADHEAKSAEAERLRAALERLG
jgi:valyl-tRNA synthetase